MLKDSCTPAAMQLNSTLWNLLFSPLMFPVKWNLILLCSVTTRVSCRCIFQIYDMKWSAISLVMCVHSFSSRVRCKCLSVCVCVWGCVRVSVQQLSGCEMAIWGHTSGLVKQWARVIIRSQWDAVLFLPRVRYLSGPVSSHLDGWASLLRAPAQLPSAPKTKRSTSPLQATTTSAHVHDKSAQPKEGKVHLDSCWRTLFYCFYYFILI